jgi:polyhydroxyalkanoate synthase subunit PhaC
MGKKADKSSGGKAKDKGKKSKKSKKSEAALAATAPSVAQIRVETPLPPVPTLTSEQRVQMEKLSANLARAALTAQGAITEMALRQADRPAALNPDPFHVGPALNEVIWRPIPTA